MTRNSIIEYGNIYSIQVTDHMQNVKYDMTYDELPIFIDVSALQSYISRLLRHHGGENNMMYRYVNILIENIMILVFETGIDIDIDMGIDMGSMLHTYLMYEKDPDAVVYYNLLSIESLNNLMFQALLIVDQYMQYGDSILYIAGWVGTSTLALYV